MEFLDVTQDVGFYTVTNQRRFNATNYDLYPFIEESVINYFENVNSPVKRVQRIQQYMLDDDQQVFLSVPGVTNKQMPFFDISEYRTLNDHMGFSSVLTIEYELEMDVIFTTRRQSTFVDVFVDIGGLYIVLFGLRISYILVTGLFTLFVRFFNGTMHDDKMTEKMYRKAG